MSVFRDFWDYIQGKLLGGGTYEISSDDFEKLENGTKELELYEFALNAGINIIANALSQCEIRTFVSRKEVKRDEYYTWNYQPNRNQNAAEFMHKLVWNLIYRNECLVIENEKHELVIADGYTRECYAFQEDTFHDITVCSKASGVAHPLTLSKTFRMSDVLFYQLNNQNVKELLGELEMQYQSLMESALEKFQRGAGERGILMIDGAMPNANFGKKPDGTPRTFNDVYNELVNKQFANYFRSKNGVLSLWKGFSYDVKSAETTKKSTSELKDVTDLTGEIFDRVANALLIPPALLRGDVADTTHLVKNLITFAVNPIAEMIQTENNRKRNGKKVLKGTYQMVDTSKIVHMDVSELANAADKMIGSGMWSVDDALTRLGDAPIGEEWSKKHWITKNYTEVTAMDGGGARDPTNEGGL